MFDWLCETLAILRVWCCVMRDKQTDRERWMAAKERDEKERVGKLSKSRAFKL